MKGYTELMSRLREISKLGYVKTHRKGDTGIGKTLEDLLGIEENNIPGPDGESIELKAVRKYTSSMLTLFTKSPMPRSANSAILKEFGYPKEDNEGKKELHTTLSATGYNTIKGKIGLRIAIGIDRIQLLGGVTPQMLSEREEAASEHMQEKLLGWWLKTTLTKRFETKLPRLLYVKAEARNRTLEEEFWFNEAWLMQGFDFQNFINLLQDGKILVDVRIGQYADGKPHDHGTGFRVRTMDLDKCFSSRERVV